MSDVSIFKSCVGKLATKVDEWFKITTDPWILESVRAYRLEFKTKPSQISPPLQPSRSEGECNLIQREIDSLLLKGAITVAQHSKDEFLSNIFLVPKKTGDLRPVINLKPLSEFVHDIHFKMENIESVKQLLRTGDFMATIDLKDAYFSIPIDIRDRKYLRFLWNNTLYEFTCLPFGYSLAPRIFTKILKPAQAVLRRKGIRIVCYIDDILVFGHTFDECSRNVADVCELLCNLGYTVNKEKSQLRPSRTITFLGFLLNSADMVISLPSAKVNKIVSQCQWLLDKTSPTVREVAQVSGLLVSSFSAVKYMRLFYRSIEMCKSTLVSTGVSYDAPLSLTPEARLDLQWVIDNLHLCNGVSILDPVPSVLIECDASNQGWGACCGSRNTGGLWSMTEAQFHINYLETLAAFFALQCFASELRSARVQIHIDNTAAVFYLNNMGGTRSTSINKLAREIWQWCIFRDIELKAVYIPGSSNGQADFNSRRF